VMLIQAQSLIWSSDAGFARRLCVGLRKAGVPKKERNNRGSFDPDCRCDMNPVGPGEEQVDITSGRASAWEEGAPD